MRSILPVLGKEVNAAAFSSFKNVAIVSIMDKTAFIVEMSS